MRTYLIPSFVFAVFFISCHNDVPDLPLLSEVQYCKYENRDGRVQCKSTYEISKEDCVSIGGEIFPNAECEVE